MVILDTSFLLTMLGQHREFDMEVRTLFQGPAILGTVDRVVLELQRLARVGSSKKSGLAKVTVQLLEKRKLPVFETPFGLPEPDTSILSFSLAYQGRAAVATVDRKLRDLLMVFRIPTVFPRKRRGLLLSKPSGSMLLK